MSKGYRPVVKDTPGADKFPTPADLFDITKFGGWDKVNTEFFDPEKGIVAEIFQSQGKSTAVRLVPLSPPHPLLRRR